MPTEISAASHAAVAHARQAPRLHNTICTKPILIAAEPNYEACLFSVQKDYLPNPLLPAPPSWEPLTRDQIIACAYWQSSVLEQISTPLINSCLCEHTGTRRDSHQRHYLGAMHINVLLWQHPSALQEITQSTHYNFTWQRFAVDL